MGTDYAQLKANGFMLQKQQDHFSMRLRVVGGNLTIEQLDTIRRVADKYGAGYIHLTSRQGVEIPFIQLKDIEEVVSALNDGGVSLGASGPRVRTVTACQGGRVCPSGRIDAYAIAEELDKRYYGRNLPHKFKLGVTGCPNNCLKAEENDLGVKGVTETRWEQSKCVYCGACQRACAKRQAIRVEPDNWMVDAERCNHCGKCVDACRKGALLGRNGYLLTFGGTFGASIRHGRAATPIIFDKQTLFRVVDATIDYFERNAAPKERLAATIERRGWDEFQTTIRAAYVSSKHDS
ncbi:MAG: 4Fe-4S binding protein [Thermoguttaceae bacterium]|nr:4Fe-4S binding protein [Thermoguttaceae bacterium]